jgi:maleate isomerase
MDTQAANRPAGWRARIGAIVPVSNTTNEVEFNRMTPDGVTVHFTRVPLEADPATDDFAAMLDAVGHAASELAAAGADVIAYACTSGSMACPPERLDGRITLESGKPALTTAGAILRALEALGIRSLAMATPYTDATNARESAFIERHGFRVTGIEGMGFGGSLDKIQKISRVPPREVFDHARSVDGDEADALLICCTDLGTADILQQLEDALGKPVISSNSATFWASLRTAGIDQKVTGYGRLLSEF